MVGATKGETERERTRLLLLDLHDGRNTAGIDGQGHRKSSFWGKMAVLGRNTFPTDSERGAMRFYGRRCVENKLSETNFTLCGIL